MGWYLLSLLLLLCIGSIYSQSLSYNANCPPDFKQYEDRSCFRLFVSLHSFQSGSDYCTNEYNGSLLTISSTLQYNRTSTYTKLYGSSGLYWIGLMYRNNPEGDLVLTDIDGNAVNDISLSDMGSGEIPMEGCVYMSYGDDGGLRFVPDNCNSSHGIVCLTEWPAPPAVNISSTPSGYGISGQQVNLMCEVPSVTGTQPTVQWRFNGNTLRDDTLTNGVVTHQINNFQSSNEGNYSCVVATKYWSVSSDTVNVKMAVPPSISRQPMNATFYMGQQGFFECLPDKNSFPKPSVMWYKDRSPINISTNPSKYFISPNTKTLLLSQVTAGDTGEYRCVLSNPAGNVSSNRTRLDVMSLMDMSGSGDGGNFSDNDTFVGELRLKPQPLTVFVGENATFDCVGPEGSTSYQWVAYNRDGHLISTDNFDVPENRSFSSWTYTNVALNGIHMVQCVVTVNDTMVSSESVTSENVTLEVVQRAEVTGMSNDTTVQYGSDYELTCNFTGTPSPTVEWLFNGVVKDDHKTEGQVSVLTVKDFQPPDVGVYQCRVSNQYGSGIGSTTLYGKDGLPGYVIGSVFSITTSQVSVSWFFIGNPNSDPDLIQFQITWNDESNDSVVPQSILVPPSNNEYDITGLYPSFNLSVTMVAVTPSVRGSVIRLPHIFPFGYAPNFPPNLISVLRVDDKKALNISWEAIIPNRTKGEGDIFDYEIQYRNKKIPLAVATEQVSGTWVYIDGLYFKGVYEVRVRCVVMVQSVPLPTEYKGGPWSKWVESTGESNTAAPITGSDDNSSAQVVVPVVISVVLVLLGGGVGIYVLWRWRVTRRKASDRGNITYSSMKNENAEEEVEL